MTDRERRKLIAEADLYAPGGATPNQIREILGEAPLPGISVDSEAETRVAARRRVALHNARESLERKNRRLGKLDDLT